MGNSKTFWGTYVLPYNTPTLKTIQENSPLDGEFKKLLRELASLTLFNIADDNTDVAI